MSRFAFRVLLFVKTKRWCFWDNTGAMERAWKHKTQLWMEPWNMNPNPQPAFTILLREAFYLLFHAIESNNSFTPYIWAHTHTTPSNILLIWNAPLASHPPHWQSPSQTVPFRSAAAQPWGAKLRNPCFRQGRKLHESPNNTSQVGKTHSLFLYVELEKYV